MSETSSPGRGFLWSTALVTLAAVLTKLVGFFRETAMAAAYGAGAVSDAFTTAFTVPGIVVSMVGASAAAAYIPVYYKVQGSEADKQRFASNVINCAVTLGLVFTVVFTVFPQLLVYAFASQYDAERFQLASQFLRIVLLASVPLLIVDIFRAHLQMDNKFFFASVIGAVSNLCIIPAILLSKRWDWLPMLGVGTAVGYYLILVALAARCRANGMRYQLYVNPKDQDLRQLAHSMMPVILAVGIVEINQLVDRNFASWLPTGSVSCLNYAARVSGMVTMLMGATLVTVLFPKMSKLAGDGDMDSVRRYLSESIRKLFPILLPLTVGALLMSEPLIRLLFQRGEFTAEDTRCTAECLQMYAMGFFLNSVNPLLIRAFYAIRDTKTPALCSLGSVGFGVVVNLLLIGPLQHRGLALATSGAALVSCILLNLTIRRKIGGLGLLRDIPEHVKTVAAAALMGGAVWVGRRFLPVMESGSLMGAVYTLSLVLMGVVIYVAILTVTRTQFMRDVLGVIKSAARKRNSG